MLFTSISGGESKIHDDDWNKLEVLFKQKKVGFHGVDGSLPERKAAREALWGVSGEKKYPQVFVDKKCESCCCCLSPPCSRRLLTPRVCSLVSLSLSLHRRWRLL